jgi:hypothetical protein
MFADGSLRRGLLALALGCASSAFVNDAHAQAAVAAESAGSDQGAELGSSKAKEPEHFEWLVGTADVGYRALDLRKIEYGDTGGAHGKLIPATAGGVSPGVGLGMRLWFVSLMLHGDVTFLSDSGAIADDLELWNLDLEGAFRMMQGRFQPFLLIGVGYSALAGASDVFDTGSSKADAHGANGRLGIGFDYYFQPHLTVGFRAHADGLLLASQVSVTELATPQKVDTLGETKERLREADGSLAGMSYAAGLTFGLHYL